MTNCRDLPKMSCLDRFLGLDRDISIVETNFWKPSRFSRPSRLIFFGRRDRDLDRDQVETNRDPQAYITSEMTRKTKKTKKHQNLQFFARLPWNDSFHKPCSKVHSVRTDLDFLIFRNKVNNVKYGQIWGKALWILSLSYFTSA